MPVLGLQALVLMGAGVPILRFSGSLLGTSSGKNRSSWLVCSWDLESGTGVDSGSSSHGTILCLPFISQAAGNTCRLVQVVVWQVESACPQAPVRVFRFQQRFIG